MMLFSIWSLPKWGLTASLFPGQPDWQQSFEEWEERRVAEQAAEASRQLRQERRSRRRKRRGKGGAERRKGLRPISPQFELAETRKVRRFRLNLRETYAHFDDKFD